MARKAAHSGFGRGRGLQWARKALQLTVLFLLVWGAMGTHWRNLKTAHNNARLVGLLHNDTAETLYRWNNKALSVLGDPLEVSEGFLGAPWHARVAGIDFTDPWALFAVLAGGALPPLALLLSALLPLGIALVLGKVFCGFLCPARLMFELGSRVRQGLMALGLDLPAYSLPRLGLWVGLGALLFTAVSGAAAFHFVLPYAALSSSVFMLVLGGAVSTTLLWLSIVFAVDVLLAPGQFCRSLCPTGALLEQVGRKRLVVLDKVKDTACPPSCDLCRRACPYGLFPGRKAHLPVCDSCGRCTPVCPDGKLAHTVSIPGRNSKGPTMPGKLKIAAALAVLLAVGLASGTALAHHNKGLPHYGYFKNYPQVPTEEFIIIDGRWEVGAVLFNFQGLERATSDTPDDVKIFAYAYDLQRDEAVRADMSFDILRKGELVASTDLEKPNSEAVYVTRQTMPASGAYELVFRFKSAEGEPVAVPLPFRVDLRADRINWALIGGMGSIFAVIFGLALAGRGRKHRSMAAPAPLEAGA